MVDIDRYISTLSSYVVDGESGESQEAERLFGRIKG